MPFASPPPGHSQSRGAATTQPPAHSAHCGDANQAEVAVNESFLHPIQSVFAVIAFVDFLAKTRKLERVNDGTIE
jgi:hypothetical protein